jgi:hypothetical protein
MKPPWLQNNFKLALPFSLKLLASTTPVQQNLAKYFDITSLNTFLFFLRSKTFTSKIGNRHIGFWSSALVILCFSFKSNRWLAKYLYNKFAKILWQIHWLLHQLFLLSK